MKKNLFSGLLLFSITFLWAQVDSVSAPVAAPVKDSVPAVPVSTPVVSAVKDSVPADSVSTPVASTVKDSTPADSVSMAAGVSADSGAVSVKQDTAMAIFVFASGAKGHFLIVDRLNTVVADFTKKEGSQMEVSLKPGLYTVEMEQRRDILVQREELASGQKVTVAVKDVLQASEKAEPVVPVCETAKKSETPTAVVPAPVAVVKTPTAPVDTTAKASKDTSSTGKKSEFKADFSAVEFAWAVPVGDAGKYSSSKSPDGSAVGMESGGYFGIARNVGIAQFTDFFGIGFFSQWGIQANPMNDKYKDNYSVGYFNYDFAYSFRMEYEIGPSLTFALGHGMFTDLYLKGGFVFVSLPAFDNEDTVDGVVADSTDEILVESHSSAVAFGFGYGFGVKFRVSFAEIGADVNLGKEKFNGGDYGKLPVACVRLIIGLVF